MARTSWPRFLLIAMLPLALLSACGDEAGEPDPVALAVALFDDDAAIELPKGFEQTDDLEVGATYAGRAIAGATVYFESDDATHEVYLDLFRSGEEARAELRDAADGLDINLSDDGSDASGCLWDDLVFTSFCMGHRGPLLIEVDSFFPGPDEDADPEKIEAQASELYEAIEAHIKRLIDDAPDDVAPLPRRPLAALLMSIAPPPAPDGTAFTDGFDVESDDLLAQFDDSLNFGWTNDDGWRATFYAFVDNDEAETYRDRWIGNARPTEIDDPEADCVRTSRTETDVVTYAWSCIVASDEVLIFARHDIDSEELDDDAADLVRDLVSHVEMLRAGELPPAARPDDDDEEGATKRTRQPEASPTVAPTATVDPGPDAVNAGPWKFTVTVTSNDCGGQPAPGSAIELEYKATELTGDNQLRATDFFKLEQIVPGYRDFGVFAMTLPVLELDLPVTNGEVTGVGRLSVEFVATGTAHVRYVEDYGSCSIAADSQQ